VGGGRIDNRRADMTGADRPSATTISTDRAPGVPFGQTGGRNERRSANLDALFAPRGIAVIGAAACIAGYTVVIDISMRDWQWRTMQWDQGKNFEASTPVGPFVVTGDELGDPEGTGAVDLEVICRVDGESSASTVRKGSPATSIAPPDGSHLRRAAGWPRFEVPLGT
jgi:hypothetical protein